jgi:hypothetical protein
MKYNSIKIIILVFIALCDLQGQEFVLTDIPGSGPKVDPFTKDIYFWEVYTGKVLMMHPPYKEVIETDFPSSPTFAHHEHKAIFQKYIQTQEGWEYEIYLYNFEEDSMQYLTTFYHKVAGINYSWTDQYFFVGDNIGDVYYPQFSIYSFGDSLLHLHNYYFFPDPIYGAAWDKSDSSLYMLEYPGSYYIFKYNIFTDKLDTLVTLDDGRMINYIAYNSVLDIVAYETQINNDSWGIYFYNINLKKDTLIFDLKRDDPNHDADNIKFTSLVWSPSSNKLLFIGYFNLVSISDIYVYFYINGLTHKYTKMGDGLKYNPAWLNEDTVLFDVWREVHGFDITKPLKIDNDLLYYPEEFELKNFPNPFNNSTIIQIHTPVNGYATINIYSAAGHLINQFKSMLFRGENNFSWDGRNKGGDLCSTGVYLIQVSFIDKNLQKMIKTVLIK